ncbi:hypothetical protein GCM10011387_10580 [Pedobacter quisquiliarum]|uniref:DUF1269 domain-containing protein n=1 Tax=Pedobacter quisquiliarum TaxID=1834438 RepID=A0A916U428_9SPHI|nr:DUF1269 domain-containing protein [Pedobacter quisquiliarum]GGC58822.1 hypothetical protein GCM10011387_10580 [Pedobacter quisquiliarum]
MEKMIQAVFNSEVEAFKGLQAIQQLGNNKDISVGETYILTKDAEGKTSIRSAKDSDAGSGTLGGGVLGGLIGLLAGPLGLLVGVAGGMIAGSASETLRAENVSDYLDAVAANVPNGRSVLVAHIWEDWEVPLNTAMLSLTSDLSRYNLDEQVYVPAHSELTKVGEDIKAAETKYLEADGATKADWNNTLQELRTKRENLQRKLNINVDHQEQQYQAWIDHHTEELEQDEEMKERLRHRAAAQRARLEALKKNRSEY